MKYSFERDPEGGIILVIVDITDKNLSRKFQMVLDTGATCSAIDSNVLLMEGYELKNSIGTVDVETANGIIEVEVFEIGTLSAFGIIKQNTFIQVYDFLSHGITSAYQGVLGLDFFENTKFCIDMKNNTISVDNYLPLTS